MNNRHASLRNGNRWTPMPVHALEGSVVVTGSLVQRLRDNLGTISVARGGHPDP